MYRNFLKTSLNIKLIFYFWLQGESESDAWYATLDFGTNYCNLKNLIVGANLIDQDNIYAENSTNEVCTMYSLAHCNFYS